MKTTTRLTAPITLLAAGLLAALTWGAADDNPYAPDRPEPGSVEAIAGFTTEPRFSSPLVAYVPDSATVPSPTRYLGHVTGAAGELTRTEKIYDYFRELDRASERVRVFRIGTSEEGREILLAAIADEEGIRDLDRLEAATAALADPRTTSPAEAERIIATARPFYYFNAGLHSVETGPPEMVMELAYRLAVSEQPMIRRIRRNVVVLINPVSEPDGHDKMVDWFYRYLKGKTDYGNLPEISPPYWGYYVKHDNNRDTHQRALALTRAVAGMFFDYHPVVVHDLHESIPLLHTWNGTGPYNAHLDPIVTSAWLEMSFYEVTSMTAMGMPGVWTWGFGESWGLHYLDSVASNHNGIGRGYETFGNHTAETVERTLRPSEEQYAGEPVTAKEWYRPWPPDRKFRWSLRDNTNYMETACLTILDWSAGNAARLLRDFYRTGYNSWQKGLHESPRAYAIPEDQGDRRRVAQMVNLLRDQRIEVSRASRPFTVKEGAFDPGTFIVRLDQPYRNYAVDLLSPQHYPHDAKFEPYDDVSWAFPVNFGLEAIPIDDERIATVAVTPVDAEVQVSGRVTGRGPVFLLKDTGQEALLAARYRLARYDVEIAEESFETGGVRYPAGSWILPARDGLSDALARVSGELGLDFDGVRDAPTVARHPAPPPRIALWHTWADTETVGWVRYVLDQEEIPYTYIRDEDIVAGGLHDQFDVIVYGDVSLPLKDQIHGIDPRFGPMPYRRTAQTPSFGVPDGSDDITGGIGWRGMASLASYLDAGGLLVTLGNASALPLEGGLVRDVSLSDASPATPGAEIAVRFTRPDHPLAYGYPDVTSVFRADLAVYDVAPPERHWMVMQWGTREDEPDERATTSGDQEAAAESMVISGGGRDLEALEGHPAILDVPAGAKGQGRLLAYNFNPIHRNLNRSDYRLLWNAILNWHALPPAQR